MGSNKKRPLHRYTLNGEPERENERRRSIGRDWINLSICQLHGWVCLVAAVRLRLSLRLRRVHRSQVDRRVYTRVCVRLRENPREPRLYTRPSIYLSCCCPDIEVCVEERVCVCWRSIARLCEREESGIRNRVARGTDSTSSIGAPNEQEDRIDSPVT